MAHHVHGREIPKIAMTKKKYSMTVAGLKLRRIAGGATSHTKYYMLGEYLIVSTHVHKSSAVTIYCSAGRVPQGGGSFKSAILALKHHIKGTLKFS